MYLLLRIFCGICIWELYVGRIALLGTLLDVGRYLSVHVLPFIQNTYTKKSMYCIVMTILIFKKVDINLLFILKEIWFSNT